MTAEIDVRDLAIGFPAPAGLAVDGVFLEVSSGSAMGVVGESGSGKTLSALALVRLIPEPGRIAAGNVRVAGVDVVRAGETALRRLRGGTLGLVLQEPSQALNPVRTIGFQVSESARLHNRISRSAARSQAAELLAAVGLDGRALDAYPHELSGGQRQRALIAAALCGGPSILVADEPTSALDTVTQLALVALLERLRSARGLTLLLISHDLPLVARACDRITVLHAGETVESGSTPEVVGEPLHPYTRALLAALPGTGGRPISGRVPRRSEWGAACRFAARCPAAMPRCHEERPPYRHVGAGRRVRCWLHAGEAIDG